MVIPVNMALTLFLLMTTVFSIALVSYITLMYPLTLGGHVIGLITAGAFLVILTHFVAERLAADLAKLPAQLGTFSIRDTKCTCCQMNHIDPDSGEPMVCDRVLVYATLATWFAPGDGSTCEEYRDSFDESVKTHLRPEFLKLLQGSSLQYKQRSLLVDPLAWVFQALMRTSWLWC